MGFLRVFCGVCGALTTRLCGFCGVLVTWRVLLLFSVGGICSGMIMTWLIKRSINLHTAHS